MSDRYLMPSLGSGMTHGTVIEWYVKPGQVVHRGDVIGLVDTDKGAIEVEVWEDAEVVEILAAPETKAAVGEPLLVLRSPGGDGAAAPEEDAATASKDEVAVPAAAPEGGREEDRAAARDAAPRPEAATEAPAPPPEPESSVGVRAPVTRGEGGRASPAARKRAAELDIGLSSLTGTGPGGAVTLEDVEKAAGKDGPPADADLVEEAVDLPRSGKATPLARQVAEAMGVEIAGIEGTGPGGAVTRADVEARAEREGRRPGAPRPEAEGERTEEAGDRHRSMRQAIAAAMSRSKKEIPHYYLGTTVSMEAALRWLQETNRERPPGERILPAAVYLKCVSLALGHYPEFNGFWEEGAFRPAEGVHPGMAISLRGGGLVAPAIHDVPRKSLGEITAGLLDLVQRARSGRLRASEVTDPTITVTSLGDRGVETVFGVIYPPQVAIVGIGSAVERPWAERGMLGVRRLVQLTLAADHRASDGHRGGLFLEQVSERLQMPEEL